VAHHNHPPTIVTIIQRKLIALSPESQIGNLLTCLQESSSANFQSQITRAVVHLAQGRLILCRAMRIGPGTRFETHRVLEMLAALTQVVIEATERLREA